jgi:hypothetical protein
VLTVSAFFLACVRIKKEAFIEIHMTTNDKKNESADQSLENIGELLSNQSVLGEPEPWEKWETQLCLWSIGIGVAGLIILGVLVDLFLLPG